MKVFKLFFIIYACAFAPMGVYAADFDDVARAASRTNTSPTQSNPITTTTNIRSIATTTTGTAKGTRRTTNTVPGRTGMIASEPRDNANKSVISRSVNNRDTAIVPRTTNQAVSARTNYAKNEQYINTNRSRAATTTRTPRTMQPTARTTARTATVNESGALVTNYRQCREIYYECMDEFCANKDANLRRCACSARVNEFDGIKRQMSQVEDKMLDFNQRLLTVNMDADDAKVINVATEGEDAFYATKDTTKSKRVLDDIAKKLNTTFDSNGSSSIGLSPVSWSLNIDAAFDTVDSFGGADTTSKTGVALYAAATPICRDIAQEVCSDEELGLAISGYQMMIEQDCNTVRKSYQSQVDAARTKVFESSALLDMSRLDKYQQKNSDDILTCKRKMLDMLTNTTVCGENLEKCLDMTGKYIDPSTGAAFLTLNLSDLDLLINRPTTNQTWTSANSGSAFITYLNNKKKYIEPAMANCVDISDSVWDEFVEDALSQIKLAQTAKIEEIRRACTTLTAECLTTATDSINEFDSRALSVFGVSADRTVNAMCRDVRNSCAALLDSDGVSSWETGISNIATNKTLDTILSSCTQVGRNCIIQSCKSISGNFDLCDDVQFSANRHAILERTACWSDVLACVAAAGDDAVVDAVKLLQKPLTGHKFAFYDDLYGKNNISPIYDICSNDCGGTDAECATCRIAERIWGNCETIPSATIQGTPPHNRIYMPLNNQSTLMSWFAINTGTADANALTSFDDACINTRCLTDITATDMNGNNICLESNTDITTNGMYCPSDTGTVMNISSNITNCCFNPVNAFNHQILTDKNACCATGNVQNNICLPSNENDYKTSLTTNNGDRIICIGNTTTGNAEPNSTYPSGQAITCNGRFILIKNNEYKALSTGNVPSGVSGTKYEPEMYYLNNANTPTTITTDSNAWFIRY